MSTTRKIRCTDCGEAVPYGRLSCPSCGTLLASVAGGVAPCADRRGRRRRTPTDADRGRPRSGRRRPVATSAVAAGADAASPTARSRPPPRAGRPAGRRSRPTRVPTSVVRSVTAGAGAFIPAAAGGDSRDGQPAAAGPPASTAAARPRSPATRRRGRRARARARGRRRPGRRAAGVRASTSGSTMRGSTPVSSGRLALGGGLRRRRDAAALVAERHRLQRRRLLRLVGARRSRPRPRARSGRSWSSVLAVVPTQVPTWISRGLSRRWSSAVFALGLDLAVRRSARSAAGSA